MRIVSEDRQMFDAERAAVFSRFSPASDPSEVLAGLTLAADRAVMRKAASAPLPPGLAFVAVGGYGRGEMFPYSDLDLLVVVPEHLTEEERRPVADFLTSLWDLGLTVGATERKVSECLEACSDITVATALLESRLIGGDAALYDTLRSAFSKWLRPAQFYRDKRQEMLQRHARTGDSPYGLEPNVKESPGGLRDLQMLVWVAHAAGLGENTAELARNGLVSETEAQGLRDGMQFLRRVRIALQLSAGRHEDRLIFDLQEAVAHRLDYTGGGELRASEALMKDYYRNARAVIQLCIVLMAVLEERFSGANHAPARRIDEDFAIRGEELDVTAPDVFARHPGAALRAFYLRATLPGISRMSTRLLRTLWHETRRDDFTLPAGETTRDVFLAVLRMRRHVFHTLRDMNSWGILGLVLPAWSRIVGQMQHDLFHVYTVDQHTLEVVRMLRLLTYPEHTHEFPLLSQLMAELPEPWLLNLAALFHDIGKGRGGDHPKVGALEMRAFAQSCALKPEQADFLEFLVREHITMSHTAQREDISDPEVLRRFAAVVKTPVRLKALYILTVCDIRATGPKIWNSWKGQLLERLYLATAELLGGKGISRESLLEKRRAAALAVAAEEGISEETCRRIWEHLDLSYFLRHTSGDIAWHAQEISEWKAGTTLVRARPAARGAGIDVLVFTPDRPGLFARILSILQRLRLSVLDARIHTTNDGIALDTFLVTDAGRRGDIAEVLSLIAERGTSALEDSKPLPPVKLGALPRRSRHFPVRPQVLLEPDPAGRNSLLFVTCGDRLGLLYTIADILAKHGIGLQSARISTLGDRAEDVFQINGAILADPAACVRICSEIAGAIAPEFRAEPTAPNAAAASASA